MARPGKAGTASCGKARYGELGIGRARQAWLGAEWHALVSRSKAGGATRGADCLGEDWMGMAG